MKISMPSRFSALKLLRRRKASLPLAHLPQLPVPANAFQALTDPALYRQQLLARIAAARQRIHIAALYLQDDDAGREVMDALYRAKAEHPALDVAIFVDWHRARRGLIGKGKTEGNAAMYRQYAERFGDGVRIYGVPVQSRELFGVLHLKGFVIDDTVVYSGASFNDVYLARHGRYRLDRYHFIDCAALADSLSRFMLEYLQESASVTSLQQTPLPVTRDLLPAIRHWRLHMQSARYVFVPRSLAPGEIGVTPLLGFGRRKNLLNDTILALLRSTQQRLVILTPYFNLPKPVQAILEQLLKHGCEITLIVGDKTANDFYIPPEEPFSTIGLLPYLYEGNLRHFAKQHQDAISGGLLNILLWRNGNNTYHLKGLFIDDDKALITGSNINPRAWSLDMENGLLLQDPEHLLLAQHAQELAAIKQYTTRVTDYSQLDTLRDYPPRVQKILSRLKRIRLDHLLNRLL